MRDFNPGYDRWGSFAPFLTEVPCPLVHLCPQYLVHQCPQYLQYRPQI
jgi:hypothetical protein